MATARRLHYAYDEYRRLLDRSDVKLEYCDGVIYAMAGGTPAHAQLAASMITVLRQTLRGQCKVFSSDAMVRVDALDISTFPAVTVVCGDVEASAVDANAIANPNLLVEVTSPSTEEYDRGDKLKSYQQISTLNTVLFVSHRGPEIAIVSRTSTGWKEALVRAGGTVQLERPTIRFSVDDIYADVTLRD